MVWADEIGTSSYDPAELRRLTQPQVNEGVPPIPIERGQENFFVPDIPVLEQPLMNDAFRLNQLYNRLSPLGQELRPQTLVDLV